MVKGLRRPGMLGYKSFEDQLFDVLSDDGKSVRESKFLSSLKETGLRKNDPRLKDCIQRFQKEERERGEQDVEVDREKFKEIIRENLVLIKKAFTDDFVIPEFEKFTEIIEDLYEDAKATTGGKVASYIPQLARANPDHWGVSICTIDGQRYSVGDTNVPFSLQSTSKPLTYAIAVHEYGTEFVHKHVGQEPSGEAFNVIKLDSTNRPHNPMINAGAIVTASMIKIGSRMADKFDFINKKLKSFAGGEYLGFNNAIYLSERETADRNFALGYYMQENKCFPEGTNLQETLDFYFQLCSIEVTCESASVIAATLANGGICPLTGEDVLDGDAVRNCLSLMHSCGMYDYSGQFAFKVGLPAKSGVSGAILLVIPNVMGMCIWSPPLDSCGNSERGIKLCEELVCRFNFHHYDNLIHTRQKSDPRKRLAEVTSNETVTLLFGAYNGDLSALTRMHLSGTDMTISDYDGRTALHLAAAEGHIDCVKFLIEKCRVPVDPKDRWGHTPMQDAMKIKRYDISDYLKQKEDETSDYDSP